MQACKDTSAMEPPRTTPRTTQQPPVLAPVDLNIVAPLVPNGTASGTGTTQVPVSAKDKIRADIARLESELADLEQERAALAVKNGAKGVSEEAILHFIDLLHQYNELKDAGQSLFGRLAEIEGTVVKHMYERFELNLDD